MKQGSYSADEGRGEDIGHRHDRFERVSNRTWPDIAP
jgi:hypothetical protein